MTKYKAIQQNLTARTFTHLHSNIQNFTWQHVQSATSVSYKPTDSYSYLLFSSSHPNHTKQSIPYSQFLRLRRLCSDDKDFETKSLEMRTFFVERGYPTHLLDSAIQKAFNNSRRDTLKPLLAKISDDKIPLVLTFHPFNYKVRDVISRNFLIL